MAFKFIRSFLILCLVIFLSGCGNLLGPVKTPLQSTYTISSYKSYVTNIRNGSKKVGALLVSTITAAPGFDTDAMIYVSVPFKLRSYALNRWVSTPAKLLLPIVARKIRDSGYFYAVVTPPFAGQTKYELSMNLLMLQQEFFEPESQVHLIMYATLLSRVDNQVMATRVFDVKVPAPENNPYSGVLAANKAANKIAGQISSFVIRSVRNIPH